MRGLGARNPRHARLSPPASVRRFRPPASLRSPAMYLLSASGIRPRWSMISAPRLVTSSCRIVLTVRSGISPRGTFCTTRVFHSGGGIATRKAVSHHACTAAPVSRAMRGRQPWGAARTVDIRHQDINVELASGHALMNRLHGAMRPTEKEKKSLPSRQPMHSLCPSHRPPSAPASRPLRASRGTS